MDYVQRLREEMLRQQEDEEYIELCCKYANNLCEKGLPVIFDFSHLSLLLGVEKELLAFYLFAGTANYYSSLNIPKKSGGYRNIDIPSRRLKGIQHWILKNILCNVSLHEKCMGFTDGKSIVDNARLHVNKECVLNLDIKDFFPSISERRVFFIFLGLGYSKRISYYLSKLVTKDGFLPQGSPASPMISNIVGSKLDKRLNNLAKTFYADYSRYADDITFSGSKGIVNIIPIVKRIIAEEGFVVNDKKTRYYMNYQRQEVTGLTVNKEVKVSREYIRKYQQEIYYCQKYGVLSHLHKIEEQRSFYKEHMYGKAYFIYMVDEKLGSNLLKQLDEIEWDY